MFDDHNGCEGSERHDRGPGVGKSIRAGEDEDGYLRRLVGAPSERCETSPSLTSRDYLRKNSTS